MKKILIPLVVVIFIWFLIPPIAEEWRKRTFIKERQKEITTMRSSGRTGVITPASNENAWLIGLWEGSAVEEGEEMIIKLQLLSKGKSRQWFGFTSNNWDTGWLSGNYEIYDGVIVVTTNDVDVIYSFDRKKRAIYNASKTRLYKQ